MLQSHLNKPETIFKGTVTSISIQRGSTGYPHSSKAGRKVLVKIRIRKSEFLVYQTIILLISHTCFLKYCSIGQMLVQNPLRVLRDNVTFHS